MSSIIHKEKIMFCNHQMMCPTSRRAAFYLDVQKATAVVCILLVSLERIPERCWWWSIHNAADNFFWSTNFLSAVRSNLGIRAAHQHHDNAIISCKCPASAKTTGLERQLSQSRFTHWHQKGFWLSQAPRCQTGVGGQGHDGELSERGELPQRSAACTRTGEGRHSWKGGRAPSHGGAAVTGKTAEVSVWTN